MGVEYKHYIYADSNKVITVGESKKLLKELNDEGVVNVKDVAFIKSPIIPIGKDKEDTVDRLKAKYEFGIMNSYGEQYIKRYNPFESFLEDTSIDNIEEYEIFFYTESAPGQKGLIEMFNISDFSSDIEKSGIYADFSICSSRFKMIQPMGDMDSEIRNPVGLDIANDLVPIQVEEDSEGIRMFLTDGFYSSKNLMEGEYTIYGQDAIDINKNSLTVVKPTNYGITVELNKSIPKVDKLHTSDLFKTILRDTLGINQVTEGRYWH
jgi:hypothetical protein